ncbi:hypothetical protein UG55_103874 [Frankia sp. EI5c]|uniref:CYTH and CHAD domain-containing protein n=1 Tax=Frankia sp. EI5c TaxID=683316 RepID=UPI0007C2213D|nr:CYTH and CHAD domain-containing protein [Frankia sp. EI5c]OAA23377.1 hypothetical protein UG55_103874 [Frankia sp. EI5c]
MGNTHEVERKFDVDRTFVLPALTRVPGVSSVSGVEERHLDAVYYDTDDLRLARNRLTLRRREGGHDQGWHLKLPAGDGERDEIQRPPGEPGTIPDEFLDLLAAHLRGRALRPVAQLSTIRRARLLRDADGTDLIEIADDIVKARTMGAATVVTTWREVELEAVGDAGAAVLPAAGRALRTAGARPSRAPSKLVRALAADSGLSGVDLSGADLPGLSGADRPDGAPSGTRPTGAHPTGAHPTGSGSAGEVIHRYLAEQAARLLTEDPRVRLDAPEAVHDMRVAARRLRSTVQTFRPLFDPERAERIRVGLTELGEVLGVPRDAEVQLARFRQALDAQPPQDVLGPVRARTEQALVGERLRGLEAAHAYLRGERYLMLVGELLDFVADAGQTPPARRPASKVLPRLVHRADRRLTRRVDRAGRAPAGQPRDTAHHEARKAAKRLRYACEAVTPVHGSDAARLGARAKYAQTLLGEHQDCVVARQRLREWAVAANLAGESSYTYGLLTGQEKARAERTLAEFTARWPKLARGRYRRWLRG